MRIAAIIAGIALCVPAVGRASRHAGNPGEARLAPTGYLLPATSCKMSFEAAAEAYYREVYNYDGYVNGRGEVVNGGLGCSGFVSIVLHRMRYGNSWQASYDSKLYQDYGNVIARKSTSRKTQAPMSFLLPVSLCVAIGLASFAYSAVRFQPAVSRDHRNACGECLPFAQFLSR